jgi:hypothetical protein
MNGLDVRALGWVVTIDVCGEILRSAVGRPTRFPRGDLPALRKCWLVVWNFVRDEENRSLNAWLGGSLATALTERSEVAVGDFVDRVTRSCPALYGERALRMRCLTQLAQALVFGALGTLLAYGASAEFPSVREAALLALAVAGLSLVTTLHLARVYLLVKRIGREQRRPDLPAVERNPVHKPSDRTTHV